MIWMSVYQKDAFNALYTGKKKIGKHAWFQSLSMPFFLSNSPERRQKIREGTWVEKLFSMISCINNGNWTEWSAIWSEIIRVISKSNERAKKDVILCVANLLIQYNQYLTVKLFLAKLATKRKNNVPLPLTAI